MNRFQPHLQLNKVLNQEYSTLQLNYPLTYKTVEWYIRIYNTIGKHEFERIVNKQKIGDSKVKLLIWIFIFQFWNSKKAILHLQRLNSIHDITCSILKKCGLHFWKNKGNSFVYTIINSNLLKIKWFEFVENLILGNIDDNQISKIESQINRIIDDISKFLVNRNINIIVTQDLHTDHGYILAQAAKKANIPSVEFAHCYTQDEFLVTILPVNGNYSILWTNELVNSISEINGLKCKDKLKSFGYPKYINLKNGVSKDKVLLLFPGLQAKSKDERITIKNQWIRLYEFLLFQLNISKEDIIIRPHPGDNSDETNYVRKYYCKNLSKNRQVEDDLKDSRVVIGGASTVLVDAIHMNIPAIQIVDFQPEYLPNEVSRIHLDAFMHSELDLTSNRFNNYTTNDKFKEYEYKNFLESLL